MSSDINILSVKLCPDGKLTEGGISISNGKIAKIGKDSHLPQSDLIIQGKGLLALPGLTDVHVHLRDLELSYKEDYLSGTCAAAAGGFTSVIDMPNTRPVTDTAERLTEKMEIAKHKIVVKVGFNIVPSNLTEVDRAVDLAMGYKINLVKPWSNLPIDESSLTSLIRRATSMGKMVIFHAEDGAMVDTLESRLREKPSFRSYYSAHPSKAEDIAVAKVLGCMTEQAARVHFCHISSLRSLRLIKAARAKGKQVTCEATPHHMFLNTESSSKLGGISIMDPPLRKKEIAEELFHSLKTRAIDIVATDHAPHSLEEKKQFPWWKVPIGIPGLETALPLMLTEVRRGKIPLGRVLEAMAQTPAKIFGLNGGELKEGGDADIVLVDLKRSFKIDSSLFLSKAKYSPFDGRRVIGKVEKTFVDGRLVFDQGHIVAAPGSGAILSPRRR